MEPKFKVPERPSKLAPFVDKLSHWLKVEAGKSRKQKRTVKQLHADFVILGYEGSYGRVAAFVRDWKIDRQRAQQTSGRGVFVRLIAAEFVMLGTSLPPEGYPAEDLLNVYRLRWQIELAFKRLKSLLGIDQIPTRTERASRSWLTAHLIMALFCDDISQEFLDSSP